MRCIGLNNPIGMGDITQKYLEPVFFYFIPQYIPGDTKQLRCFGLIVICFLQCLYN